MRAAMNVETRSLVPQTSPVPIEDEHAEIAAFSAVILPFSAGHLASAAKRTKEAAKAWKGGRSMPSAWSMLNMAREIPAVRNYMLAKLGPDAMQFNSPKGMNAAVQIISGLSDAERGALMKLMAGRNG